MWLARSNHDAWVETLAMASPKPELVQKLHNTLRAAAANRTWSRGVELVRADAVAGQEASGDEVVCRVLLPGRAVSPTVVLYPEDEEWDCDCASKVDPCEHVVAAVIAVGKAHKRGSELPVSGRGGGRIRYYLERESGGLYLDRRIVTPDGREHPLGSSLSSRGSSRAVGPGVTPTQADLQIDLFLGAPRRRALDPDNLGSIFELLSGDHDVRLAGEAVGTSGERVVPRALVRDASGGGVSLRLEPDPRIDEVVARGVVRCGRTLHPAGETELSGLSLERLPFEKVYGAEQVGELVTEVLPELKKRMPVDVRSARGLPSTEAGPGPRISFDIEQEAGALSVLPTLVYGNPPRARIDGGRMVHLGGAVPVRDEAAERSLVHALRDELNLVPGRRARFEGQDAMALAGRLRRFQGEDDAPVEIEAPELEPTIDADGLEVSFRAPGEGQKRAGAADVLSAYESGFNVVPLEGGGFGRLPAGWLEENGHRVAQILAAKAESQDGDKLPAAVAPAAAALLDDLDAPRPAWLARLSPLIDGFEGLPPPDLPADLTAELRGYQREGVAWLSFLRSFELGGVLADDMGLGKTLQALCALRGRTLVVAPTSVAHNWLAEIEKFRPSLRAVLYHGPRRELDDGADIVITTYGILRQDAEELAAAPWDAVVLDEAQAIKNPDSQVARAAYRLRAPFRLTLTGTPLENRLDELWSQLHFANPGLLGGRGAFQERLGRRAAAGDPQAAARLREVVSPFILRRLKRDVAPELPPRTEMVLRCELTDQERAVYDAVRAAAEKDVVQALEQGSGVLEVLELLLRLRQASCHSGLIPGHDAETSSKIELLLEHVEEIVAEGHKALVFSQFTALLDRVEPHLRRAGIEFLRLDGSTRDREAVVRAFQDESGPPVMLISLKAGGTGLNLTEADHVYLLDPWWNPAAEDQAADRAHRIGQDKPVMVYRLVAQETVEDRILALQEKKRALFDTALGGADRAAKLSKNDLFALLSPDEAPAPAPASAKE